MRKHLGHVALLAVVAALAVAWVGQAQDGQGVSDEQFVQKASAMDLAEINLGRVAEQNASDSRVKQYGQRMVADHTKSSKELLTIADKLGVKPATKMEAKHAALFEKLGRLKGQEFDTAYMKHMAEDHEMAVMLFKQQAKSGKDAGLRAFAEKTLPVIEEHLKMAKALAGKGAGGKGADGKE